MDKRHLNSWINNTWVKLMIQQEVFKQFERRQCFLWGQWTQQQTFGWSDPNVQEARVTRLWKPSGHPYNERADGRKISNCPSRREGPSRIRKYKRLPPHVARTADSPPSPSSLSCDALRLRLAPPPCLCPQTAGPHKSQVIWFHGKAFLGSRWSPRGSGKWLSPPSSPQFPNRGFLFFPPLKSCQNHSILYS